MTKVRLLVAAFLTMLALGVAAPQAFAITQAATIPVTTYTNDALNAAPAAGYNEADPSASTDRAARYMDMEASYKPKVGADQSPWTVLAVGDSRTGQAGRPFIAGMYGVSTKQVVNIGIASTLVQENRWYVQRSELDLHNIQKVVINGPSLNNMNHPDLLLPNHYDTVYEITQNLKLLIREVGDRVGHKVDVTFIAVLGQAHSQQPTGWPYTEDERLQINQIMSDYCVTTLKCRYIALPADMSQDSQMEQVNDVNDYFTDVDGRHYTDAGYTHLDTWVYNYLQANGGLAFKPKTAGKVATITAANDNPQPIYLRRAA